jgi:hypothetical protein
MEGQSVGQQQSEQKTEMDQRYRAAANPSCGMG